MADQLNPGLKTPENRIIKASENIPDSKIGIERAAENFLEQREVIDSGETTTAAQDLAAAPAPVVSNNTTEEQRRIRMQQIEKLLAEGMEDFYIKMPANEQRKFKIKGEEVAAKINILLDNATIKIKTIIDLIKSWLAMIPGVNKYFLEQEAKIRADRIIKIKNK